ncbi:spermine synthase-like isoform X1 [Montipora foliosa]|uniref:spermine synthase-like isoform X1 n=2 Tax=Montipora foliosa TaxID=591990 RepID=UPI0035F1E7FF
MSVNQTLLDFRVTPVPSGSWMKSAQDKINDVIKDSFQVNKPDFSSSTVMLFTGQHGIQGTVRLFPDGLITLDVTQYLKGASGEMLLQRKNHIDLRDKLDEALSCLKADFIPTICRGREILCYHDTSDGRLKEYDFDKSVFRQKSQYQDVWIAHSIRYGNMLFLDLHEMLAEADVNYTKALLGNGRECYKAKDILILGGGDGGVLHELLKEEPKFVTMVEIDEVVVNAAAKYMRGACGNSLDSYTEQNYEIRIDDCLKALKDFIGQGKTFDYVINDLTDIPIAVASHDSPWDFVREILNLTLKVLKPGGKFYAQGTNGANCKTDIEQYEKQLMNLCCPVEFRQEFVYVPSFEESWTFYEVWRK